MFRTRELPRGVEILDDVILRSEATKNLFFSFAEKQIPSFARNDNKQWFRIFLSAC